MTEEDYGPAPHGVNQSDWEGAVLDEAIKLADHAARWRGSLGANEALREAKRIVRRRKERE